jgi:GalNAc-alpha-(1->4)-GalNAc-alpha-(1->3)-diNAcBac-PP-undecaprenol alpha-1,4-N-acetyl-D-galactosaminyltransferase
VKILCIISALTAGGAEKVMIDLTKHWSLKYEVHLLTFYPPSIDFFSPAPSVHRHSLFTRRRKASDVWIQFQLLHNLRRQVNRIHPDVVISFVAKTNVLVLLALLGLNSKVIACEHSIIRRGDIPLSVSLLRYLLYPKAYRIGVLSQSIQQEFFGTFPYIPKSKVVILPNPIELPSVNAITKPKTIETPIFRVISLGRFVRVKGFHRLAEIDKNSIEGMQFIVFGSGEEHKNVQTLLSENGLDDYVILPGRTGDPFTELVSASVFLSTSDFEGFPMAIAEAMAAGLPIVAFEVPGVKDLVIHGKTGLLSPFPDMKDLVKNLRFLKDNPNIRKEMSELGKSYIIQFSIESVDRVWHEQIFNSISTL